MTHANPVLEGLWNQDAALGKQLDVALWHNHNTILPVRLIDGAALNPSGQIWRRCHHGEWQYKQDPETLDDYEVRQF